MTDDLDAVLKRVVASEVAKAPQPPTTAELAARMPRPSRSVSRAPWLVAAAIVVLLVVAAVVVTRHDRFTHVVSGPESTSYVLPSWPPDLELVSAQQLRPNETAPGPPVFAFRKRSDSGDGGLIVVLWKAQVIGGPSGWQEAEDGTGELSFAIGDVALSAFTRPGTSEADARALAAALRPAGVSAPDALALVAGSGFVQVPISGAQGPAPLVTWRSPTTLSQLPGVVQGASLTMTLHSPQSGLSDVEMLPVPGVLRKINGLAVLEYQILGGEFRGASWLEPDGTWVTLRSNNGLDLDRVIASLRRVNAGEWARATTLTPSVTPVTRS